MPLYTIPSFTGTTTQGTPAQQQINGVRFTVVETTPVDILSFYRRQTTGQAKPTNLTLWQMSSASAGSVLAVVSAVVDDGNIGWQDSFLSTPVTCSPGITYQITGCHDIGVYGIITNGQRNPPDYPFSIPDTTGRYRLNTCANPPDTDGTNAFVMVRAGSSGASAPDPGETPTNLSIENAFARWLHSEDAPDLRPNSLPVLIYGYLQTMQGVINDVQGKVLEVEGVVEGILGPTGALFTGLLRGYLDNLDTLIDQTLDAVDNLGGADNRNLTQVYDAIAALPTSGEGGLPAGPVSVANGWTLRETIPFVGKVKTDEPADAYILLRTGWDSDRDINVYEGVTYLYDRGWWAHQQGDVIEGYGTLAAATHLLRMPTGRMSGVLIVQDDDIEGDLQVWDAPA
jgi:hypothetical protein